MDNSSHARGLHLLEAEERVRLALACSPHKARVEICRRLADETIWAYYLDPETETLVLAPPGEHWLADEIHWESSRARPLKAVEFEYDPFAEPSTSRPLGLVTLIDRASFEAVWPSREKPAHQGKPRRGRRTMQPEIRAAYEALERDGEIDFDKPMTKSYPKIRFWITGNEERSPGLGDEVIRTVVSPLFERDRIARKSATVQPT